MIRITSKQEGFRRCGISHTKEPVEYPDSTFTAAQVAALQAETQLIVDVIIEQTGKKK